MRDNLYESLRNHAEEHESLKGHFVDFVGRLEVLFGPEGQTGVQFEFGAYDQGKSLEFEFCGRKARIEWIPVLCSEKSQFGDYSVLNGLMVVSTPRLLDGDREETFRVTFAQAGQAEVNEKSINIGYDNGAAFLMHHVIDSLLRKVPL